MFAAVLCFGASPLRAKHWPRLIGPLPLLMYIARARLYISSGLCPCDFECIGLFGLGLGLSDQSRRLVASAAVCGAVGGRYVPLLVFLLAQNTLLFVGV